MPTVSRGTGRDRHKVSSGYCAACKKRFAHNKSFPRHQLKCRGWKKDVQPRLEDLWRKDDAAAGRGEEPSGGPVIMGSPLPRIRPLPMLQPPVPEFAGPGPQEQFLLLDTARLATRQGRLLPEGRIAFVGFIVGNGIPLIAMKRTPTRLYLQTYAQSGSFPQYRATLRADILDCAKEYKRRSLTELSTNLVTIIADGMSFGSRGVWCVLGFWIDEQGIVRIAVLQVLTFQSATAKALATDVAVVVRELVDAGALPIALMSDNGPNVKSAFGKGKFWTVGRISGVELLQLSCSVHTGHLVFADAKKDLPRFREYCRLLKAAMRALRCPRGRLALGDMGFTGSVPMVQEPKWCTKAACAQFVIENLHMILRVPDVPPGLDNAIYIDFARAIVPMISFINAVQATSALMSDVFMPIWGLLSQWRRMAQEGSHAAVFFGNALKARFSTTGDASLIALTFSLTHQGHAQWCEWQTLSQAPLGRITAEQAVLLKEVVPLMRGARSRWLDVVGLFYPDISQEVAGTFYDGYFAMGAFWQPGQSPRLAWSQARWRLADGTDSPAFRLCDAAARLTQLPASEAVAERFFSVFTSQWGDERASALPDLLEAEMILRWWLSQHPGQTLTGPVPMLSGLEAASDGDGS